MIFKLDKNYAPENYRDSRDYRVFLKLLGVLLSVFKYNIDSAPDLYSPDNCPDHLVNLLASMVGYKYNDSISIDNNRLIIKYFPYMIRKRGSREGLKLATALSLNTSEDASEAYTLNDIIIEYDFDTGMVKIYYPYPDFLRKDLIEAVRPVGSFIKWVPSFISTNTDELDIKATVKTEIEKYDNTREKVGKSKVGFGNTDITLSNENEEIGESVNER